MSILSTYLLLFYMPIYQSLFPILRGWGWTHQTTAFFDLYAIYMSHVFTCFSRWRLSHLDFSRTPRFWCEKCHNLADNCLGADQTRLVGKIDNKFATFHFLFVCDVWVNLEPTLHIRIINCRVYIIKKKTGCAPIHIKILLEDLMSNKKVLHN